MHALLSYAGFAVEILELCNKYKDKGVVAIDIAGDENGLDPNKPTDQVHRDAFKVNALLNLLPLA